LAHQVELQFCKVLAYLEHYTIFSRFFQKADQKQGLLPANRKEPFH